MKRGQITMFMIIGIIILLGAGMLIYMAMLKPEKRGDEAVVSQSLRQAAVQPVKDYIVSCLDIVSSDALDFIGKQGGRLYVSQGGTVPDPGIARLGSVYLDYGGWKLFYSIIPPEGTVSSLFFSEPPEYPWPDFPYSAESNISDIGFFGLVMLPPLYRVHGVNSLQEQIEEYIANNIRGCVDFTRFPGFEISAGLPNATMIIAENITHLQAEEYISFVLDWPVTIKEQAGTAKITLESFSVNHPIAFGRIYYAFRDILERDVSNISYEPETSDAYFISIIKDVYGKDDVIVYQDKKYNLNARPYEFRAARKNRAPALYRIDQFEIDKFAYCVDIVRFSIDGDTLIASPDLEDDDIFPLALVAADPDGDAVSFRLDPKSPRVDSYSVASYAANPSKGGLLFKVIVSDGELEDFQQIRIIPKGCEIS